MVLRNETIEDTTDIEGVEKMKARKSLIVASILAIFAAGVSAAHVDSDEGVPQHFVAMQADEGVPQNLVAMQADEGVPQNLVAMQADEGVPQNLVAMQADEGIPQNLVA